MDSYFASVEQQANPTLRGKPIIVTGKPTIKTVVAAASKEAKKYGVKSAMSTWKAKQLCPEVTLVPGDPEKYEWVTKQFLSIFRKYTPRIEVFGIDEAFLDLTDMVDVLGSPVEIAEKIKSEIRAELGEYITCSIGIAKNKLLAKLASDINKPDGIKVIQEEDIESILDETPMTDLCGIDKGIKRRLQKLGIQDLKELGEVSEELLKKEFGIIGTQLKLMGQGKDLSPVRKAWHRDPVKSIGNSLTLPSHKRTPQKAFPILFQLCQKVGYRLRKHKMRGKTVKLLARNEDLEVIGKQKTVGQHTDDGNTIYSICKEIAEEMRFPAAPTMVGVRVSNLKDREDLSSHIFPGRRTREKVLQLMDSVNDERGAGSLYFARQLEAEGLLPSTGSFKRLSSLW